MDFEKLVSSRRTIRRFEQREVPEALLRYLIDMARYSSCASNKQPLRYLVIRERELVRQVFETTRWAGLVAPRRTPRWEVDAPLCFIALTVPEDAGMHIHADAGAAIQSMELAAWEKSLGCCWFASFDPEKVGELVKLPDGRRVLYLVAVGFPAENPVTENAADGRVAYYLDAKDVLHVPKLPVDEITTWL
ncbi:MAG: nitroreductase family protein [Lentisphaeria bacterium]|nr:nitroreductase family protein [Lentisphaeria bacterium]